MAFSLSPLLLRAERLTRFTLPRDLAASEIRWRRAPTMAQSEKDPRLENEGRTNARLRASWQRRTILAMEETQRARQFEGPAGLLIAVIAATGDLTWIVRTLLVLIGIGLVANLAWHSRRHWMLRLAFGIVVGSILLSITWHPIWADFQTKYPQTADTLVGWLEAITNPYLQKLGAAAAAFAKFANTHWVRWSLLVVAVVVLFWGWRPFWGLRHRIFVRWRRALGSEVWVRSDEAQKLLRQSTWGRLREPRATLVDTLSMIGGQGPSDYQKRAIKFAHFVKMTLDSFAEYNPNSVRIVNNVREYREDKLLSFLEHALDDEAIKDFGSVPTIAVE